MREIQRERKREEEREREREREYLFSKGTLTPFSYLVVICL